MFSRIVLLVLLVCLLGTLAAPVPKKALKQVKMKRNDDVIRRAAPKPSKYYKRAEDIEAEAQDAEFAKPTPKPPKPSSKPYKRAEDDAQDADLVKPTPKPPKPSSKPY